MRTLGESKVLSFFTGVNQGNEGGRRILRFPCVIPGVWELLVSVFPSEMMQFSAFGVFVVD